MNNNKQLNKGDKMRKKITLLVTTLSILALSSPVYAAAWIPRWGGGYTWCSYCM